MKFDDYCKIAIAEYPRLCDELHDMTKTVANQISGATFTSFKKKLTLSAHDNNILKSFGQVEVSEWCVTTAKGVATFIPDGLSIGVTGRIRFETKAKNPFYKGCVFTTTTENDDNKWCLVTLNNSSVATAMTEERLLEVLKNLLQGV